MKVEICRGGLVLDDEKMEIITWGYPYDFWSMSLQITPPSFLQKVVRGGLSVGNRNDCYHVWGWAWVWIRNSWRTCRRRNLALQKKIQTSLISLERPSFNFNSVASENQRCARVGLDRVGLRFPTRAFWVNRKLKQTRLDIHMTRPTLSKSANPGF